MPVCQGVPPATNRPSCRKSLGFSGSCFRHYYNPKPYILKLAVLAIPQALEAVIEENRRAAAAGEAPRPPRYTPENAPLLVSVEDPGMQASSSAVMVLSQQRDLVRLAREVVQSQAAREGQRG